ncbi:hypothetical protein ACFLU6_04270 [Acidobacteriota bacterium]
MSFILQTWQFLLIGFAGWVNRQQQRTIEYLITENQVLREKVGKERILLNDDQRRRLAVKGKLLGRRLLQQLATIVSPDTILRWHRQRLAQKWDYSDRRKKMGRPRISEDIVALVVQLARENPSWGYERTIKEECLARMVFFGERSLRKAIREFCAHYHGERNHQGLGNRLIEPGEEVGRTTGELCCRERLGGMLRYYCRRTA